MRPRAAADIDDAVRHYEQNVSPSVARKFVAELRSACDLLARTPNIGSTRFARFFPGHEVRYWTLRHFPFRIFYIADSKELQIVAIEHAHRDVPPSLTI